MLSVRTPVKCATALAVAGLAAWLAVAPNGAAAGQKPPTARSRHGAVPPALVGKWGFAVASGVYCNGFGNCAPGSGGSISFTFRADGRAEYALFESALVDGCGEIQSLTLKRGTFTVDGSTIAFSPKSGTYKSVNGCRPDLTGSWKFEAKDLKPVALGWRFVADGLQLVDPGGEASGVYSRR
jgi:hypothetical protein